MNGLNFFNILFSNFYITLKSAQADIISLTDESHIDAN